MASYEFLYASGLEGCQNISGGAASENSFRVTNCGHSDNDWMLAHDIRTINPELGSSNGALLVWSDFFVGSPYATFKSMVLPAVILKPSIIIPSGDGSYDNPYILQLDL